MILYNEPFDAYRNSGAASFHGLLAYERSPLLYKRVFIDRVTQEEKDSRALVVGAAAHALILEGDEAFQSRYAVRPDTYKTEKGEVKKWNGNADYCRSWIGAQEGEGKDVLTVAESQLIERMALAVESCPELAEKLEHGRPEVTVRVETLGLLVQCRFDWLTPDGDDVDLKTCEDVGRFKADARIRQYHRQRAWYRWVAGAEGITVRASYLAAIEKSEPYRAKLFEVDETALRRADEDNAETLEALCYSFEHDYWPGDHDGSGTVVLGVGDFYASEA